MIHESISVVVPVYRSAETLPELVGRLQEVFRTRQNSYEIILVNDGSPDRSWSAITRLAEELPHVRGIDLSRNYGQHAALLCGIRAARHPLIVTVDDDLQHPPEEIPLLLEKLAQGYDVVYGTPIRQQHGLLRDLASTVTKLALGNVIGVGPASQVSAFRAFRTRLREAFGDFRSPFVSIDVLLTWATTRYAVVPVRHLPRQAGASNYTLGKLVLHAVNMFTGFSIVPLRLTSYLGFGCTLLGVLTMVWVLGSYLLYGPTQPGFSFLASIIAIFSGTQMFALGILGEYLARVHFRLMEKPPYVIHAVHDGREQERPAA